MAFPCRQGANRKGKRGKKEKAKRETLTDNAEKDRNFFLRLTNSAKRKS